MVPGESSKGTLLAQGCVENCCPKIFFPGSSYPDIEAAAGTFKLWAGIVPVVAGPDVLSMLLFLIGIPKQNYRIPQTSTQVLKESQRGQAVHGMVRIPEDTYKWAT